MTNNTTEQFQGFDFVTGEEAPRYTHSPAQVNFYMDLCGRKKLAPQPIEHLSGKQLGELINALTKMPDPATDEQKKLIIDSLKEVQELGSPVNYTEEQIDSLNKKQASDLIEMLLAERKRLAHNAPCTREQLVTLCTWYICPDIPFEDWGIAKTVKLEEMTSWTYESQQGTGVEVLPFRQMTANEFARECNRVFKKSDAQAFINQYSTTYQAWRRTRIREWQIDRIRQLESFIAGKGEQKQYVWDPETQEYTVFTHRSKENYDGYEYQPLSKRDLAMLSSEEADKLIAQLQYEMNDNTLRWNNPYDDSQEAFTFKHSTYSDKNRDNDYRTNSGTTYTRLAKDTSSAFEQEMEAINMLIIYCESRTGYENTPLRDMINHNIVEGKDIRSVKARKALEDFMFAALDTSSEEALDKTMKSLYSACEGTTVGAMLFFNIQALLNA